MYIYLLLFVLLVIAFFDIYWIIRLAVTRLLSKVLPSISIEEMGVTYSLCWTTDLDYFFHMNNGKYFREMDFARFDFYFRTGCSAYIEARPKMFVVQHGASIRYRRSIDAFVPFKVVTRLIFWDERSLYFEQSFVSLHDGFVRAVAICKNTVVGGSVVEMLASVGAKSAPAMPKEVELWLASQEITSSRLRSSKDSSNVNLDKSKREVVQAQNVQQEEEILDRESETKEEDDKHLPNQVRLRCLPETEVSSKAFPANS